MDKLKVGIVGLGMRGKSMLDMFCTMNIVEVVGVCDIFQDRAEEAASYINNHTDYHCISTVNYKDLITDSNIEALILISSWTDHINIAVEAMRAGKPVAFEVGGAYSIEACWLLVRTYQETGIPAMMMENCCYGREELMLLNMVSKGVFGELVHCEGGYHHDLRQSIILGRKNRHYRLVNYIHRNADVYPSHPLGPIAKLLGINRGNRFLTLTSMSSKSVGIHSFMKDTGDIDNELFETKFNQGDVITTMIKCSGGETITLTLDCSLPTPYSRGVGLHGTRGVYLEDKASMHIEGVTDKEKWDNIDIFRDQYEHPLWREFLASPNKFTNAPDHGGMDYLMLNAFVDSVLNNRPMPIDIYDAVAIMVVTTLSEQSISLGSAPVVFPDFTEGYWLDRRGEINRSKYSLDIVGDEKN